MNSRRRARLAGIIVFTLGLIAAAPVSAHPYSAKRGSSVQFTAQITGGSFVAESGSLSGVVDLDEARSVVVRADFQVRADSFRTGMSLRDRHMKEKYLEAQRYPVIRLRIENVQVPTQPGRDVVIPGTFEIKGRRKRQPIKVRVVRRSQNQLVVEARFKIRITDYGIPQPGFAVVKMQPIVDATVKLILERR